MQFPNQAILTLPSWVEESRRNSCYVHDEDKARLAIELSRQNILHQTGGPFGAAIFNEHSGELISVGMNTVIPSHCSMCHAEVMAILFAQKKLEQYKLNLESANRYVLATSAQPCTMCYGAIIWSGVSKVIISASREDVMNLTQFDEGPIPENWKEEYEKRGIEVLDGILRDEACLILKQYGTESGTIY